MLNKHVIQQFYSHPATALIGYFLLLTVFILPNSMTITSDLIGYWGSDMLDTLSLHWAVFNPKAHFYPDGFQFWSLTPNILDHLTFWPFQNLLPFPLGANLWWIMILWSNALAAHWMGLQITQRADSAWLAGMATLLAEPILREINWGHAPQSFWFFAFISLGYWFRWERSQHPTQLYLSAIFAGLLGWGYLFYAPFILIVMIPRFLQCSWKTVGQWTGILSGVLAPNLLWLWTIGQPMTQTPKPPPINGTSLLTLHSNDWLWWWRSTPIDIANQLTLLTLVGIFWMFIPQKDRDTGSWGLWCLISGGLLIMGSHTPFFQIFESLPLLNRLQWPERFGMVALTGSLLIIVRLPKPLWFAPLLLIEMPWRSENIPLHTVSMKPYECYRQLASGSGAIISLPIKDGPSLYNLSGMFQQYHHRSLVNPFILPPFIQPPAAWEAKKTATWMTALDGDRTIDTLTSAQLLEQNITSIIIDKNWVSTAEQQRIIQRLTPLFGNPVDLGCLYHWSMNHVTLSTTTPVVKDKTEPPHIHSLQVPLR